MNFRSYELFFKALSNGTRLEIISTLRDRPKNVGDISKKLGIEQSRASHNLRMLATWGLVRCETDGKQRLYSIDGRTLEPLLEVLDPYMDEYGEMLTECGIMKGCKSCDHMED